MYDAEMREGWICEACLNAELAQVPREEDEAPLDPELSMAVRGLGRQNSPPADTHAGSAPERDIPERLCVKSEWMDALRDAEASEHQVAKVWIEYNRIMDREGEKVEGSAFMEAMKALGLKRRPSGSGNGEGCTPVQECHFRPTQTANTYTQQMSRRQAEEVDAAWKSWRTMQIEARTEEENRTEQEYLGTDRRKEAEDGGGRCQECGKAYLNTGEGSSIWIRTAGELKKRQVVGVCTCGIVVQAEDDDGAQDPPVGEAMHESLELLELLESNFFGSARYAPLGDQDEPQEAASSSDRAEGAQWWRSGWAQEWYQGWSRGYENSWNHELVEDVWWVTESAQHRDDSDFIAEEAEETS